MSLLAFIYRSEIGKNKVGPFKDRREVIKKLCTKAGVRQFRFHALRHAGASLVDNANLPIGAIQRILGHENRTTTEIYLHSLGDLERDAMAIYEQISQNSCSESHTSLTQKHKGLRPRDPNPTVSA